MAKKNPQSKQVRERQAKYAQNLELGMTPYNAAIVAGYKHEGANALVMEAQAKGLMTNSTFKDIAERKGITPVTLVNHLAERAGFFDRESGAKKVLGVAPTIKNIRKLYMSRPGGALEGSDVEAPEANEGTMDWIEVPDDKTQHGYMLTLLELLQYTGKKVEDGKPLDPGAPRVFNITFNVLPEQGKEIAKAAIEIGMNGHGANGNGHMNGNGANFTVVD